VRSSELWKFFDSDCGNTFSDPTQIDWGNEKDDEEEDIPAPQQPAPVLAAPAAAVQTFKCTALYSYTVSLIQQFVTLVDFSPQFSRPKTQTS
jgi:hypothetical protein